MYSKRTDVPATLLLKYIPFQNDEKFQRVDIGFYAFDRALRASKKKKKKKKKKINK